MANTTETKPANNAAAKPANKPRNTYKPELIKRSPSFLTHALQSFTERDTRDLFEHHEPDYQCRTIIGPPGKHRLCWLCGFPIGQLLALRDKDKKPVFHLETPMLDRDVCEHVLPVKLAHGLLELVYLGRNPMYEKFLHTEYEYAHNYCNFIKGGNYFVSLPLGSTDLCSLTVKEEVVDEFLFLNFHKLRGIQGSTQHSLVTTTYEGDTYTFNNPVQAYCFAVDRKRFLADREAFYRDVWFPRARQLILDKMNRVVSYIKEIDNCGKENGSKGTFFAGLEERLRKGLPTLGKGLREPNFTKPKTVAKFPEEFERYKRFAALQRQPSAETLALEYPEEKRVLPFRSKSFEGYSMNLRNRMPSRITIPNVNRTRKSNRASPVLSEATLAAERNTALAAEAAEAEAEAAEAVIAASPAGVARARAEAARLAAIRAEAEAEAEAEAAEAEAIAAEEAAAEAAFLRQLANFNEGNNYAKNVSVNAEVARARALGIRASGGSRRKRNRRNRNRTVKRMLEM